MTLIQRVAQNVAARVALVAFAFVAEGCCSGDPWSSYPERTPPDQQYVAGGLTHGYDIYVWECLNNQRVVVYDYAAEYSCESPTKQTAPCGQKTAIEKLTANDRRLPIRQGKEWR